MIESSEAVATTVTTTLSETLAGGKIIKGNKNGEMYVEDQDEEVEEEEEFHEVEEEKHKTSQESVGSGSPKDPVTVSPCRKISSTDKQNDESIHPVDESCQKPPSCVDTPIITDAEPPQSNEPTLGLADGTQNQNDLVNEDKNTTVMVDDPPAPIEQLNAQILNNSNPTENDQEENLTESAPSNHNMEIEKNKVDAIPQPPTTDWANIMLNSGSKRPESENSEALGEVHLEADINELVEQTQELKLNASSDRLLAQDDEKSNQVESHASESVQSVSHPNNTSEIVNEEKLEQSDDLKSNEVEKKQLDLDEDEGNPQYIPKKGNFYEHDDRSHNVEGDGSAKKEENLMQVKDSATPKKPMNQEKQGDNRRSNRRQRIDADRWNHDLFRDEKHKPKSNAAHAHEGKQQDRVVRSQGEGRAQRSDRVVDRTQGSQDGRSRQSRDGRVQRQNQTGNRSRERKPRRQNVRNSNRADATQTNLKVRDLSNKDNRTKSETKEPKDTDEKQPFQPTAQSSNPVSRKENDTRDLRDNKSTRTDSRGRRRTSRDRPNIPVEEKLPPTNTVMPPITTWSNEDMVKAEAFSKDSPSRQQLANQSSNLTNVNRTRPNEYWSHGQPSKSLHHDRPIRAHDERQSFNSRGRYQDRNDDMNRMNQFPQRNQFNERTNHGSHEWSRGGNYTSHGKPNDYIVKTQTFENSRLSQANRSNNRDLRDVLNERRLHEQQQFQVKSSQCIDSMGQHRSQMHSPQYNPYNQQNVIHQQHMMPQLQAQGHLLTQHQQVQPHSATPVSSPQQQFRPYHQSHQSKSGAQIQHAHQVQAQTGSQQQHHHLHNQRQATSTQQNASQPRLNSIINNVSDVQDNPRIDSGPVNSDESLNTRPIIKTDTYTGTSNLGHTSHQPGPQHITQNHRAVSGSLTQQQQGPTPPGSHIVTSHLGSSNIQTQYYTPSSSTRDTTAAAALASAYHGFIPGGHSVMDSAARYHMTSQLSDHGYMTSSGQAGDVTAGQVIHQQGMYADANSGGTVANSAYMPQTGSTLSPSSTIPVTGSGGPQTLAPVSYLQHSQYPPPPYSNPYPQHQHGQAPPPHSGQAYGPYWAYM